MSTEILFHEPEIYRLQREIVPEKSTERSCLAWRGSISMKRYHHPGMMVAGMIQDMRKKRLV
jgi:hypothetical protein